MWSEKKDIGEKNCLPVPCVFGRGQDRIPVGLQECVCSEPDEIHGKGGIRVLQDKLSVESSIVSFRSLQHAKPLLFMGCP